MKNTNVQTDKNIINKLAINNTMLATGLIALMTTSTIVQADELVKAEPIKQTSLYQEATESLALSFSNLALTQSDNDAVTTSLMAKQQRSAIKNTPITLTKVNLVSE
jgi:hypothetical protein